MQIFIEFLQDYLQYRNTDKAEKLIVKNTEFKSDLNLRINAGVNNNYIFDLLPVKRMSEYVVLGKKRNENDILTVYVSEQLQPNGIYYYFDADKTIIKAVGCIGNFIPAREFDFNDKAAIEHAQKHNAELYKTNYLHGLKIDDALIYSPFKT